MCLQLQFGSLFLCMMLILIRVQQKDIERNLDEWECEKVRYWCGWWKSESNYQPLGQIYTYFTDFDGANGANGCYFRNGSTLCKRASTPFLRTALSFAQYARAHLMAITLNITIALYD